VDVIIRGEPVEYNGASFFLVDTSLWQTDGTPKGTRRIRNFRSSNNGGLQVFNNQLVFSADYPELGRTLWISDGTSEGTKPVFDTSNNKTTRMIMLQENPVYKGAIYFKGLNEFGYELWRTDGTVKGTYMVKDIWEGNQQSYAELNKNETVELNGSLFFGAANEILGYELWKTDGTEEGTVPVTDINPQGNSGVSNMTLLKDRILFIADDGSSGKELWSTDGTIDGTMMIKDIYPGEKSGIPFSSFINYKDHIYFQGESEGLGRELWRTDGTEEGTELFIDLFPEEGWSRPFNFQIIEDQLYFLAFSEEGRRLFKTDGTVEGTVQVTDAEIDYSYLYTNGVIFYDTYSDLNGNQLWRMHPGEGEPVPVQGVPQGNRSGTIQLLNYTNNTLFFTGFDNIHGRELWALSPLEASVSIEMTGEAICSTEDTLTLQAIAMNTGEETVLTWHINGVALAGENAQYIELTGLRDGDEIKVSAEADNELWLINDNPESEVFTVSYNNPAAEITVNQNTLSANQGASYIWYLNGSALNESNQSLTVTESGTYTVEVFNESGCSSLSNPLAVVINPTGLELLSGTTDMEVFPNPATDIIKLRSPIDRHLTLNITNLNGERVYSRNIELFKGEEYEIAAGNLPNGIYIIQGISGSDTFVKRLIIQ
jgi:ELWxxDGT repeat protein